MMTKLVTPTCLQGCPCVPWSNPKLLQCILFSHGTCSLEAVGVVASAGVQPSQTPPQVVRKTLQATTTPTSTLGCETPPQIRLALHTCWEL